MHVFNAVFIVHSFLNYYVGNLNLSIMVFPFLSFLEIKFLCFKESAGGEVFLEDGKMGGFSRSFKDALLPSISIKQYMKPKLSSQTWRTALQGLFLAASTSVSAYCSIMSLELLEVIGQKLEGEGDGL